MARACVENGTQIPNVTLHWTPPGKRKRTTWRRTITSELEEIGFSMCQDQYIAKDRGRWRQIVDALCSIGDEEDKLKQCQSLICTKP